MKYDIAIIGGGPAGYTAGERAAENGLKTILFEKNAIGGGCLKVVFLPRHYYIQQKYWIA